MAARQANAAVDVGFEQSTARISIDLIQPLKLVTPAIKKSPKYAQIVASIREVGLVEAPVVARDRSERGKYLLLDGHLRIDALMDMGVTEVDCLVSTDDEAFTYNRRINRIAIIQEHRMILKAVERGASEEKIAKALNVNVDEIRRKRRLLEGICVEAIELLEDKHVALNAFGFLRKMTPLRQIEAAELMVAMNKYSASYARSLLAATPQSQLVNPRKRKPVRGLTAEQMALMEKESAQLEREFRLVEQTYGTDHLHLVLAKGYLGRLLANERVFRYLEQHHHELLFELGKVAEIEGLAA
ncbi:MAG: chromosome partitioning protein ParB [Alphaproteobacteria bacterium]|nr:chromosome partitioning protein ParB [Alphaproteobacteria bacterium]